MKTTTKNRKRNDRFLKMIVFKTIVLKNDRFFKLVVSLTIVNDGPSLTIVYDDPLLTIVNKERKPIWRASVLNIEQFLRKYQEVLAPQQLFNYM